LEFEEQMCSIDWSKCGHMTFTIIKLLPHPFKRLFPGQPG